MRGINVGPTRTLGWLPVALVLVCALFAIRSYAVTLDAVLVLRLFWTTRILRAGLQSATFDPKAMRGSLRTFGNGGFFSITGFYWNKTRRTYRVFLTDPRHAVVLRYEQRTVVVLPGDPEAFVRKLASTN